MYPDEDNVTDIEEPNIINNDIDFDLSSLVLIVPISLFILSPLVHEMAHMMVLDSMNIYYISDISLTLSGIEGNVEIFSGLSVLQSSLLLSSGVLAELFIGSVILLLAWKLARRKMFQASSILAFISVGFFSDPILYFFARNGDLITIMQMVGMANFSFILPSIGILLSGLMIMVFYKYMKMIFCFSE